MRIQPKSASSHKLITPTLVLSDTLLSAINLQDSAGPALQLSDVAIMVAIVLGVCILAVFIANSLS